MEMRFSDFKTVKVTAQEWHVTERWVLMYCKSGRIEGAIKRGGLWLIPEVADKPVDARRKNNVEQSKLKNEAPAPAFYDNKELFQELVRCFPYPLHIYAPDGTLLWANDAFLRFNQISHPERLYYKHNILRTPEIERWGLSDFLQQAYRGEVVRAYDIKVPYPEIIEKFADDKQVPDESLFQNITSFPIWDAAGRLQYIVTIFITSRQYQGKEEILRGKEYIEEHWKEEFDIDKLAGAVHVSRYHYTRLFKQHTGTTPYHYYQEVKVQKLKECLCDPNLSVTQVFAECGADYSGSFAKIFKEKVGMTPSQYRDMLHKK